MTLCLASLLRDSAFKTPDASALVAGETVHSFRQLHEAVQSFAVGLRRLGVQRGEHVALMMPNIPAFSIAYYALHYLGCPVVPLNVSFTVDELTYHLQDSDAVALIVWEDVLGIAKAAAARSAACRYVIGTRSELSSAAEDGGWPDGVHDFADMVRRSEPGLELPDTQPEDTAVILYTSGTTGRPKGAELTHFNLLYNAEYTARSIVPMTGKTVALCTLPLFHSFGQTVIQNAVLSAGGSIILLQRFDAERALLLMQRHRVDLFAGVPTMYFALLSHPSASERDLSSLTYCISGGAPMPVEVMRAFNDRYGVQILEGYGLSETSPVASFNLLDRPTRPGSIGVPISRVEFKLLDDKGAMVAGARAPGELCIKGPNVMKGYYKRSDATAESIREGWFSTGDIAERDEDGFYYIVDRKKDMILRGGYNVYPREIEEVLYGHPAVLEAAVIGVPNERLGEEVKALLVLKTGTSASPEDMISLCKERLAPYKIPRFIEFRENLPKTATGKILKRELR
jgi:long-chain acyl-CoA synthetase